VNDTELILKIIEHLLDSEAGFGVTVLTILATIYFVVVKPYLRPYFDSRFQAYKKREALLNAAYDAAIRDLEKDNDNEQEGKTNEQ